MDDPVTVLRAIADPVRWKALTHLREPDESSCCQDSTGVCACDLERVLGVSQPTVSHHMRQLVDAGLVKAERRGRWVFYELDDEAFTDLSAVFARFVKAHSTAPSC